MADNLYKIGTVSKRTGISPERLRAWERRYGLEPAERSGKTRFYSGEQLTRLGAIKSLIDEGHPISQLAALSDAEIEQLLADSESVPATPASGPLAGVATGLIGAPVLRAHRKADNATLKVVAEWAGFKHFRSECDVLPELGCVIAYLPSLDPEIIKCIEGAVGEIPLVATFKYAGDEDLEALASSRRGLQRWPASWAELESAANSAAAVEDAVRSSRFTEEALLHIADAAQRRGCDTAEQLVELVESLNDFDAHASRIESGVGDGVADAVRKARTHLERALADEVEVHGLMAEQD